MDNLTHFQRTMKRLLQITEDQARQIQTAWPLNHIDLGDVIDAWNYKFDYRLNGLQVLEAVDTLWSRRPDNDRDLYGQEVLYHPITCQIINSNSPLSHFDAKDLAILKWGYINGHLEWDEIAIARDTRGRELNDWPIDRFGFIYDLPLDDENYVDWTDPELAILLNSIKTGELIADKIPDRGEREYTRLTDVLGDIPSLQDYDARTMLLRGLPPRPLRNVRRGSSPATDINNIVSATRGMGLLITDEYAINVVIRNAQRLVEGTTFYDLLERFKVIR